MIAPSPVPSVSAITSSVDGVESMQSYYSQYLPGLLYSVLAPIYLFFQLKDLSLPVAVLLFAVSIVLLPANNAFRSKIEKLKTEYWNTMEDLTGYYLESVQGLTTFKLFRRDEERTKVLAGKAQAFNHKIMDVMRVNFSSFLVTDGLLYGAILVSMGIAAAAMLRGEMEISAGMTVLLLSYSFFDSVRQLMSATHTALAGVSAADKVEKLLDMDTARPHDPDLPREEPAYPGIRVEGVSHAYAGRSAALRNVSLTVEKGKVTALVGLSGCGKSTVAGLLMRFFDPASGKIYLEGRDYLSFAPEELRRHILMVPQSVSLFSGTIAENLRIAKPDATEAEMLEALEQVRLKDFVLRQEKCLPVLSPAHAPCTGAGLRCLQPHTLHPSGTFYAILKYVPSLSIPYAYTRSMVLSVIRILPSFKSLPTARLKAFLLMLNSRMITSGFALSLKGSTPSNWSMTFNTFSASVPICT